MSTVFLWCTVTLVVVIWSRGLPDLITRDKPSKETVNFPTNRVLHIFMIFFIITTIQYIIMKSRFIFCSVLCSIAVGVMANDYRPVVIWHGMGDRYDSPEMMLMMDGIRDAHKGIQVYPVRLSESGIEDQTQTVLGVINDQV